MGVFLRNDFGDNDAPIQTYRYYDDESLTCEWVTIFFILSIPIAGIIFMLKKFCIFFSAHFIASAIGYFVFSCGFGIYLYWRKRRRIIGTIAVVVNLLPMFNLMTFYCVPLLMDKFNFDSVVELIVTVFFCICSEVFVFAVASLLKSGTKHLLLSIGLFVISTVILLFMTRKVDICSLQAVKNLYFN